MTEAKDSPAAVIAAETPTMAASGTAAEPPVEPEKPAGTRRASRRRTTGRASAAVGEPAESPAETSVEPPAAAPEETPEAAPARPARSRRGSKKTGKTAGKKTEKETETGATDPPAPADENAASADETPPRPARARRTRRSKKEDAPAAAEEPSVAEQVLDVEARASDAETAPASGRSGRRRSRSSAAVASVAETAPADNGANNGADSPSADGTPPVEPPLSEKTGVPAESAEARDEQAASPEAAATPEPETRADDAGESPETPHRKSRRGRRGGRGRNRKKRPAELPVADDAGQDNAENDDDLRVVESLDPDANPLQPGGSSFPAESPEELDDIAEDDEEKTGEREGGGKKGGVRAAAVKAKAAAGRKRMFISVVPGEQVEVALSEEGLVLEYYLDMLHQRKLKGNIYKGVIHNIDTNLQAAFVSYGTGKNGFLQIDEVHPEYYLAPHEPARGKKFPPIQKVLKTGQEVLVQVVKEPTGNKGAFLTTWVSLAGRFLVLTPGQEQIGVSRKVESEEERSRLREMMNGIDPGQGLGVIVRTVSAGTTKTTLKNDLQYLKRVWRDIRKKATEETAPALIYQEPGLPQRAVRDYLTEDVCEIWVDNAELAETIRETVSLLFPRKKDLVKLHGDARQSLWERFNLRRQLDQIYAREVHLPSGGRLVFDQTEALMAVDINSGKISGKTNFETMAHKTNMEAAEAIARQLKLRDVGGQVVIDFIEMRDRKHVQEVEKTLRQAMKNDRARHDVGRMSSFGLLELVRQRTGTSALANTMEPCPHCGGTGQRRNMEWQSLQALRELRAQLRGQNHQPRIAYETSPELALYLLNHKRDTLREMEQEYKKSIEIVFRP
ncbi:Rne/Rng family ribonuclease [uncultured Desulfovibrio sp.]|uniref:Rne/Rng family ribonuclease n=1 Tax=uncultured Desulfovibrio sp. TaxID=167968 RepID=UPI0026076423|nr:Rne/Rng family ribonuclease [uncultured Desulfovibrio sp.]